MRLEDKLRNLDRFNPSRAREKALPEKQDGMKEFVGGVISENRYGKFILVEKRFGLNYRHGRIGLASCSEHRSDVLTQLCSSRSSAPKRSFSSSTFNLKETVFIDCETTGLAGGVGTYAFLVGVGYFWDHEFLVKQYFMRDFHEEEAVLFAVSEELRKFKSLASYNGKCYDLPLLENRCVVNRIDFDTAAWLHLDLLFPSRRLWKKRIQDCSLGSVEQQILNVEREIDIPSYLIPQIYFDYLRSGSVDQLLPVFHHNVYDILSLVGLSVLISQVIKDFRAAEIEDPIDLYSLGRLHFSLGDYPESIACFEHALSKKMPAEWQEAINTSLAWAYKRTRNLERAAEVWRHLLTEKFPFNFKAYEELAKYYEHKERDYFQAAKIVEKARECLTTDSQHFSNFNYAKAVESLHYRKTRLERKIRNQQLRG